MNITVSDLQRSAAFHKTQRRFEDRLHDEDEFVMLSTPDGSRLALMPGEPPGQPALL